MVSPVDHNEIRMTGENSFMRLSDSDGGPLTTRASHWRALYSPAGPGHVLFLESELTDNEVRIYSDNIALARWLQEEIESTIYAGFADTSVPVAPATFERSGDVRSFSTESVLCDQDDISMTWYDFGEPFIVRTAPGSTPGRAHGVYSVMIPARRVQFLLNGEMALGQPFPHDRDGSIASTASLAWSESWVLPR